MSRATIRKRGVAPIGSRVDKIVTVDFIIRKDITKAASLDKIGVAKKNPDDKHNDAIAMIVSLARMLHISEDKISGIVDVLWGDKCHKPISAYSEKELCEELWKRI